MTEQGSPVEQTRRYALEIETTMRQRKRVAETWHRNWLVQAYFGPSPESTPDLPRLAYTACAISMNVDSGPKPDLSGMSNAIQVNFDQASVVWMSAGSRPELTRMLKTAFPGFLWNSAPGDS